MSAIQFKRRDDAPPETRRGNLARVGGRLTVLAGLCSGTAAFAQTTPSATNAPPAERFETSPGGVDMRSGRYVYSQTDLAIGAGAGLALTRTLAQPVLGHANPLGNFSHNWDILLSEKRVDVVHSNFQAGSGGDFQIEVTFGGLTQTFRGSSASLAPASRAGWAQLTWTGGTDLSGAGIIYNFQASDGSVAVFRPIGTLAGADCSDRLRCTYVSQVTRPDGTVLSFDYDTSGGAHATRLRTVTSSRGYALMFEYSSGQVSKACVINLGLAPVPSSHLCPGTAQATSSYTYGSVTTSSGPIESWLASATDPSGAVWGFVNTGITIGFTNPGETTPWLTNTFHDWMDDDGLIHRIMDRQDFADGSYYFYSFVSSPPVTGHVSTLAGGSWTDARGQSVSLVYDFPMLPHPASEGHGDVPIDGGDPSVQVFQVTPGPVAVTDALGRTAHFEYCDPTASGGLSHIFGDPCVVTSMPVSMTDPMGIKTVFTNDYALRHVTATERIPNPDTVTHIFTATTYDCSATMFRSCDKPATVTDALTHTTTYTYSPDHGGVLTERPPIPVSGAPQPEVRHIYAQRYAWISNGGSGYVQAATPVWVETATSTCRNSAPTGTPSAPCTTAGDEVLTQYDYGPTSGPNTLLLRGQTVTATDGGVTTTLRTCFSYDALGRRISQTAPNAGLGSCP